MVKSMALLDLVGGRVQGWFGIMDGWVWIGWGI